MSRPGTPGSARNFVFRSVVIAQSVMTSPVLSAAVFRFHLRVVRPHSSVLTLASCAASSVSDLRVVRRVLGLLLVRARRRGGHRAHGEVVDDVGDTFGVARDHHRPLFRACEPTVPFSVTT